MKKHLIAAAVAAAVAVPAMAQNVSISGRIDTSFGAFKDSAGLSTTKVSSGTMTTNQIVIQGSEDLGQGLKANFRVLTPFSSDTNTRVNSTDNTQTGEAKNTSGFDFGGRGIQVGLSGGFGSIDLGKSTGVHANASVVTSGVLGNTTSVSTGSGSLLARPNNSITYSTPTMSGFRGQVIYGAGGENDPSTNKQYEVSAYYAQGAFSGSVGYGVINDFNVTTDANSGTAGNDVKEISAIANYVISNVTLRARYLETKHDISKTSDTKGMSLGVSMPLAGALSGAIEYVDVDVKDPGTDKDFQKFAIGLMYDFSKRTNLYGAYVKQDLKDSTKTDPTTLVVGIRHNF